MVGAKDRLIAAVMFFASSLPHAVHAAGEVPDDAVEIRADAVKAMAVAVENFESFLRERAASAGSPSGDVSVAKIDLGRYAVVTGRENGVYQIWIRPRLAGVLTPVFGGDALYRINERTFQIEDRRLGK